MSLPTATRRGSFSTFISHEDRTERGAMLSPMHGATLADDLKVEARRLGFATAGITGVEPFELARERALDAIDAGRMAGMEWYTRQRVVAAGDLGRRYPWARSIVSLAWPY